MTLHSRVKKIEDIKHVRVSCETRNVIYRVVSMDGTQFLMDRNGNKTMLKEKYPVRNRKNCRISD